MVFPTLPPTLVPILLKPMLLPLLLSTLVPPLLTLPTPSPASPPILLPTLLLTPSPAAPPTLRPILLPTPVLLLLTQLPALLWTLLLTPSPAAPRTLRLMRLPTLVLLLLTQLPALLWTLLLTPSPAPPPTLLLTAPPMLLPTLLPTLLPAINFTGKLLIEDIGLTPTKLTDAVRPLERPGFNAQFEMVHQLDKDIWRLFSSPVKELQPLDLTNITKPSGDMEQFLEDLYQNPPEKPSPYHIGPLSGPIAQKLQSLFPSGSEVAQLGDIPGVSTLFGHVGGAASGTSSHHEDAGFRSYNLTFFGWKIWLRILCHHTTKALQNE
ncbi:hypothetical protein F5144DRAFT_598807 [Chaetomium tenue]|uniref:Uncharacterized protein n=1 Tax=Chaetomium tenue TaxID=1854479 RepID=A0ACB7PSW3_9PEZI|nr:hypothetical protein F5144DRAFT_598807 [Chaetomium globosum]